MSVASKHFFYLHEITDSDVVYSLVLLLQDTTNCRSVKNGAFLYEPSSFAVSDNMDVLCLCLDVPFEKRPFIDSADVACLSFKEAYILICISLKCFTLITAIFLNICVEEV